MKTLFNIVSLLLLPASLIAITAPVKPTHNPLIKFKFEPSQLENVKAPENIIYKCDFSIVREEPFENISEVTFVYEENDQRGNSIYVAISCEDTIQNEKVITTGSFLVTRDMITNDKAKISISTPETLGIGPYIILLSDYFEIEPNRQSNPMNR